VRLIPRDEQFFEMFAQIAQRITSSVSLLHELFSNPARILYYEAAIKEVEHEADQLVQQVNMRIDTSFVTPLDREDIHLLATTLDNVVDLIDGTARRAVMFRITDTRPPALALTEVLVRAGRTIEEQVRDIKKPKAVVEYGRKIKQLEEEGDALYHAAVGELFDGQPDPLTVIIWKELYDKLEEALDECEDVSERPREHRAQELLSRRDRGLPTRGHLHPGDRRGRLRVRLHHGFHDSANSIATIVGPASEPLRGRRLGPRCSTSSRSSSRGRGRQGRSDGFVDPFAARPEPDVRRAARCDRLEPAHLVLRIPSSSSHALIGGLAGAALANGRSRGDHFGASGSRR
jgi:uncharacterized protein Yka (UPF0111/DUF47 family)